METEQTLGFKTFGFTLLRNSIGGVFLLIISIVLLAFRGSIARSGTLGSITGGSGGSFINGLTDLLFLISILSLLGTVIVTWIIFNNTTFHLDEFALKIRTGFIDKREILIPYRQIQDVDINRPLFYRLLGVSNLVILTAGHEDQQANAEESEGVFNLMDADLAEELQTNLTKRASIQMVTEVADVHGIPSTVRPAAPGGAEGNNQ